VSSTHDSPFNPTDRMLRQFSAIWIFFFGGIATWQEFHHHRHTLALILGVLAVTLGPLGLTWPRAMRPVFIGWMALVYPIGWTVSRIVLGTIFYALFTPMACVLRLVGRDELRLKPHPDAPTYWQSKPVAADKARYLRQF
jgi:hypothetical protein